MFLRKILIQLHGYNLTYFFAANNARIHSFSFNNRKTLVALQRNYGSQNLTLFTNSWIQRLKAKNVPEAELSVKFITEHVLGKERSWVCAVKRNECYVTEEEAEKLNQLFLQRLQRIPVQYVIGEWDFRFLTLEMRPPVFIPRPETEELVQLAARHHRLYDDKEEKFSFLEVGCGSGAICLSILTEFPKTTCVAIDKSKDAINLTKDNASKCCVNDRLSLFHTDVRSVLPLLGSTKFDAIISNPPYVPEQDMADLQPEISRHEDNSALYGGRDGLDVVKEIIRVSTVLLKPEGSLWLEVDVSHPSVINHWIDSQDLGLEYRRTFSDFTQRFHLKCPVLYKGALKTLPKSH